MVYNFPFSIIWSKAKSWEINREREKKKKKKKSLPDGGDDGGWGWESRIWVLLESLTSAIGKIYELYINYFAAKFPYPS